MNNITKYNLKATLISLLCLILVFCVLAYLNAPQSDTFLFSSINPWSFLQGMTFALGFGLGFPIWLSAITIGLFSFLLFVAFLWIARKLIK
ncbi:hypothetical protein [Bacteroides sp.]|uniref:hypothetical protein n=1 Tax=Bacteroides sp. TaxID=29523 RepID=UPI00262680A0|nr:hypothetical protein [Bacteroides sp.]MDD3040182.1 hypothetical protein [Bacteroides sp.]